MDPKDTNLQDASMEMAVLKHLLAAEQRNNAELFGTLAALLQAAVPDRTILAWGGWFWQKDRPVEAITIAFDDITFDLKINKKGAVTTTEHKIVRGIRLRSDTVTMAQCLKGIVARLTAMEAQSAATQAAIETFVRGR